LNAPAALALLFLLNEFDFKAGGALAALVLGLLLNVLWSRRVRRRAAARASARVLGGVA